jgi:hypothetical protein
MPFYARESLEYPRVRSPQRGNPRMVKPQRALQTRTGIPRSLGTLQ